MITDHARRTLPIADMTGFNYLIAHLFPVMYYTDAIQTAFLKGGGFAELWQDTLALAAYDVVTLLLVHFLFRKRVRA